MYHSYFGIEEQAFSIAVNPAYLYMSAQHREALAHLLYGVKSGGFVMLTGEVGTGKTTTIRCLLEQLPANADVAIIMNPAASARDLMCSICDEFGVAYNTEETSIKLLTDKLYDFLLKNHSCGHKSIVLIDEAQILRISTLEQIRLLTNLESNTEKMLQIILVGQPELNELLAKPALRQLSQRITARYHLRPLSLEETGAYIRHRLTVAGMPAGRDPFPANVVKKVYAISGGIPRLINILCDRMLLGAYTQDATQVDKAIFLQASEEVLGDPRERAFKREPKVSHPLIYGASAVLVALIVSIALWLGLTHQPAAPVQEVKPVAPAEPSPVVVPVVQNPAEASGLQKVWLRNKDAALIELSAYLGVQEDSAVYPCWIANKKGVYCETLEATTWSDFLAVNRPAVLSLITRSRLEVFVTVIGIEGDVATTLIDGNQVDVSLESIGELWKGEYVIMWERPKDFDKAAGVGSKGPFVDWLAGQFALLDGQTTPLAKTTFNKMLEQRVKLFQRSYGLEDDGLAGMQTLLRLGEAVGRETPLKRLAPSVAPIEVKGN